MNKSKQVLFSYVLSRVESEPIHTQVQVLKALADYAGDGDDARSLLAFAEGIESSERARRGMQLRFDFKSLPNRK